MATNPSIERMTNPNVERISTNPNVERSSTTELKLRPSAFQLEQEAAQEHQKHTSPVSDSNPLEKEVHTKAPSRCFQCGMLFWCGHRCWKQKFIPKWSC